MIGSSEKMSIVSKQVAHRRVNDQEQLDLGSRLESPHLALVLSLSRLAALVRKRALLDDR